MDKIHQELKSTCHSISTVLCGLVHGLSAHRSVEQFELVLMLISFYYVKHSTYSILPSLLDQSLLAAFCGLTSPGRKGRTGCFLINLYRSEGCSINGKKIKLAVSVFRIRYLKMLKWGILQNLVRGFHMKKKYNLDHWNAANTLKLKLLYQTRLE